MQIFQESFLVLISFIFISSVTPTKCEKIQKKKCIILRAMLLYTIQYRGQFPKLTFSRAASLQF